MRGPNTCTHPASGSHDRPRSVTGEVGPAFLRTHVGHSDGLLFEDGVEARALTKLGLQSVPGAGSSLDWLW